MIDARALPDGQVLSADICIVGAGAAGIAMALEFIGTGIQVLLLESGGLACDQDTQQLYAGAVVDPHLHSPPDRYRQRRFGGSTTIWGGRCVPFDSIDFEERSYIPHSGWPFDGESLRPHYERASQLCEIGRYAFSTEDAFANDIPPMMPGFCSHHFSTDTLERFSEPTDFGKRYREALKSAPNVCLVLHANLTALSLNAAGTAIKSATARTLTGKTFGISADTFVLATGGLEVARILLANHDVQANGIGNEHDVVGRYYQCHIAGTLGALKLNRPDTVSHGYSVSDDGVYCRRRLALTAATQRRLGIGNFIARLHHPRITDPAHHTAMLSLLYFAKGFISYEYGKRLHDDEPMNLKRWMRHALNLGSDPGNVAAFMTHWLRDHSFAKRKFPSIIIKSKAGNYSLDFHAEQQPNHDSRVSLDDTRDALGQRRLKIDWRYTQGDVETVQKAIKLLASDVASSGIGRFDYDPASVELEMTRYGAYGGHHIGTARMGTDPRSSVVNAEARVHGIDNLYVAGSAVFPTSSQANPTLTIVAMASRLAQHLKAFHGRTRNYLPGAAPAVAESTFIRSKKAMGAA